MSDAKLVHLLMPIGRYAHDGRLEWCIRFRCATPPAMGLTLTTDRGDVTCAECIEQLGAAQAVLGSMPTASHLNLF